MQTWRDAPQKGDRVIALDGERGTIVAVRATTLIIEWGSAINSVVYPLPVPETIRKALPWE